MAYTFDNRVKFVVRYMYDIDNNGYLDRNDFDCLAVRNTVIEGRGIWNVDAFANNKKIMSNLWEEIATLADFNKDGQVTVEEFKEAINKTCLGKGFSDFPGPFKVFIASQFMTIDVDCDGIVGIDEYRVDCVQRAAFSDIKEIDDAFEKLLTPEDKAAGGISLPRYQELYAQFISNPDETCNAVYLFGPLSIV